MALEYLGARFESRGFAVERMQNLAELRLRYGSGRHYDRIFSGIDSDHYVFSAMPVLRAEHGATLRCHANWQAGTSPAGYCVGADGASINFRFE